MEDVRVWMVWAETLAGNSQAAQRTAATIESSSPDRPFSEWALAYNSLRDGRQDDSKSILDSLVPPRPINDAVLQQAGVIRTALLELPANVRESPAGMYALAHALLYDDHVDTARTVLSRIIQTEKKGGRWAEAAESLERNWSKAATRPTAPMSN